MSDKMEIYYFSPTGRNKKGMRYFAAAVGKDVVWHDLRDKQTPTKQPQGELIIACSACICRTKFLLSCVKK